MNKQKGFISIGILLAIILGVVVVGGGVYYIGHQNTSLFAPANQEQTNIPPAAQADTNTTPPTGTVGWKTYRSALGFEFKYPPEYPVPVDYGPQVLNISQKDKYASFDFERESVNGNNCMALLCTEPAQSQITANNITWDYVGEAHGAEEGDNPGTPLPNQVYRTVHGSCRYYVTFVKETRVKDILSGISFLTSDSNCDGDR